MIIRKSFIAMDW